MPLSVIRKFAVEHVGGKAIKLVRKGGCVETAEMHFPAINNDLRNPSIGMVRRAFLLQMHAFVARPIRVAHSAVSGVSGISTNPKIESTVVETLAVVVINLKTIAFHATGNLAMHQDGYPLPVDTYFTLGVAFATAPPGVPTQRLIIRVVDECFTPVG